MAIIGGTDNDSNYHKDLLICHNAYYGEISVFMSHYIRNIEHLYQIYLPNDVGVSIQKYVGMLFSNKIIGKGRYGHRSAIISIKNESYVIIFGGFDGKHYLNETLLINLKTS